MMMTASSSSMRFSSSSMAMPSMPGIMMSTMAASNGSARASSSPSAAEAAARTAYPSRVSSVSRISRMISSSSTTRIEPCGEVEVMAVSDSGISPQFPGRGGQRENEARPLAHYALTLDRALVLADDAVGDGQAQAGAAPDRLGAEERIVDPRQVLGRYAGPGVGDLGNRTACARLRRHRQPAAARH